LVLGWKRTAIIRGGPDDFHLMVLVLRNRLLGHDAASLHHLLLRHGAAHRLHLSAALDKTLALLHPLGH
jgi:hypothetical protein